MPRTLQRVAGEKGEAHAAVLAAKLVSNDQTSFPTSGNRKESAAHGQVEEEGVPSQAVLLGLSTLRVPVRTTETGSGFEPAPTEDTARGLQGLDYVGTSLVSLLLRGIGYNAGTLSCDLPRTAKENALYACVL
jgi:hypothetical protein